MTRKISFRKITKLKRSVKAISPVIATLLMIAIAVVASLVAYAFVIGYIGRTTNNIGKAILIQSTSPGANGMNVYVQNVGQGSVTLDPAGSVFVNSELKNLVPGDFVGGTLTGGKIVLNPGETVAIQTHEPWAEGLKTKIVTTEGTSTEITNNLSSGISAIYSVDVSVAPVGGGSVSADKIAPYHFGDVVTLTEVANPGYSFSGWSGDGVGSGATRQVTVNGKMAVTVSFTQNVYTLTVTLSPSAGGSVAKNPDKATYHYGDTVQLSAAENLGYVFSGWSGDASGVANPTSVTIDGDKQVTASFVLSDYSVDVIVSPTGGGSVTPDKVAPYHLGDVVTLTEVANPGYTFSGWSGDGAGSGSTRVVTVTTNMAVTASFTQNEYTLDVTVVGGGSVAKHLDQATYHYGDTVQLTASENIGWTFSGWSGDLSSVANPGSITINGNKAVTATFTQNQYTLTVATVGSGSVAKSPDQATYTYGQVVQLTPSPLAGWSFSAWTGDLTGSANPGSITINGNKAVTATFTQNQYTLTVTPSGSGSVAKSPDQATYTYGQVVQLTPSPLAGWNFSAWTGDLTGSANPGSITINGNKAVTATFTQNQYTLTVTPSGSGSVAKSPDQATYTYGQVVQLTPSPLAGWSFSAWTGDLTGSANPGSITINGNKAVTATFTQNQYSVQFILGSGGQTMSPSGTQTYTYGASVAISATADGTHSFSQWTATGSITFDNANSASTNAHINGAGSITANFVAQVTFGSAGTASTAATGNVQPSYPSWTAGDLIILQVLARGDSPTITVPTGFTLLTSDSSGTVTGLRVTQALYYKWAATGDTGQITVSVSGPYSRGAIMYNFHNVATSNFLESVTNPANIGSTSPLASQIVTSAGPKRLAVTFFALGDNPGVGTFTGGYTERADQNIAYGGTDGDLSKSKMGLDTAEMPTQAILGSGTATASSHDWIVRSFALIPR